MARDGVTRQVSERTGKSTFRARISYLDAGGVRQYLSKTFKSRKAADAWLAERRAERNRGELAPASPLTVAEVADRWLAHIERSRAPSTAMHYRRWYARVVEPAFGTRRIGTVTPTMVQALYDDLGTRYAGGTVAHVHKVMRGIFQYAMTDGLIRSDPTERRRVPKDRRDPPQAFTPDEARRFTDACASDPYGPILVVMLATGIRLGEALALHWADVDIEGRTARIHRTAQRSEQGWVVSERPKTASSNRTVVLPARAVLALRAAPRTSVLVFPHPEHGGLLADGTVRSAMERVCRAADVPPLTPHALRRTCATLMLRQGVPPQVAAKQLGHSVEMLLTRYAAVTTDLQGDAADALDRALRGS